MMGRYPYSLTLFTTAKMKDTGKAKAIDALSRDLKPGYLRIHNAGRWQYSKAGIRKALAIARLTGITINYVFVYQEHYDKRKGLSAWTPVPKQAFIERYLK